jgi:hypothetical protein
MHKNRVPVYTLYAEVHCWVVVFIYIFISRFDLS